MKIRKLTQAELRHLYHVVDMDRANGGYYGTRKHYELIAEALLVWLDAQIEDVVRKAREGGGGV